MRNAFIDELVQLAYLDQRIALVVGDLGYSVVEPFADAFPDRFVNAGVAEQNMMGLAAGMASEGFHVFVYSIANFPTFRCAEQIRNDVDYHRLGVTIVSVGGGLAYGNMGYSHHAVQDYGLMRMFPNMLIAAPGDPLEVRACMRYLTKNSQPSYLRLGKAGEPVFHKSIPELEPGQWLTVKVGEDSGRTLLSTGCALKIAHDWLESPTYADYSVHSIPLWGMKYKSLQAVQALEWGGIETIEDHLADCGFGSWFLESMQCQPHMMERVRVNALDSLVCGLVGSQAALHKKGGLLRPG